MKVAIKDIGTLHDTQVRERIDEETVSQYAERMQEGDAFPPVVVFHDGTHYWLADGFHRVMAATRVGFVDISADVRKGTREDALWFALGANKTNGKRLSRGDIARAVGLALKTWPERTCQQIAKQVGCALSTAQAVQDQLTDAGKLAVPPARRGADGKMYPTTYAPRATADATPEDATDSPAADGKPERQTVVIRVDAMMLADKAIFTLSGIGPRAKDRVAAFEKVRQYCKKQIGGSRK